MKNTHQLSRRQFSLAAAATSALAMSGVSVAAEAKAGWIDAHVHVWTPDVKKYPLAETFKVENMQPPSFTPQQLFAHSKPSGVDRIVLIQMSFYRFDNQYMLDVIKQHPGVFSGVGIVDRNAPDVADTIKALRSGGVRGLRINNRDGQPADWIKDDAMKKLWQIARTEDIAICPLINPADLPHVEAMCKAFPETRVVVDHFARVGVSGTIEPDGLDALCRLARFENVHVKTSAFYALGKKQPPYKDLIPMIRRVVDAFGPSRLMWASDCPFQVQGAHTYEPSIALIRDEIDFLSKDDKQAILRDTAAKVFFR